MWQFMEHLVTPKYYIFLRGQTTPITTIWSEVPRTVCYILLNKPPSSYFNTKYTTYGARHNLPEHLVLFKVFNLLRMFAVCMAMSHHSSSLGIVASNLGWTPLLYTGIEIWSGFSASWYAVGNESNKRCAELI